MESFQRLRVNFNDDFFEDGNCLIGYRVSREKFASRILDGGNDETASITLSCDQIGCTSKFENEDAFNEHYESRHRRVCAECRRSFHTYYLLRSHESECHDTFFELKAKKEPMYRCLLPTCHEKFQSPHLRKDHVIKIHKFPPDFRFYPALQSKYKDSNAMDIDRNSSTISKNGESSSKTSLRFGSGSKKAFDRKRLGKAWHQCDISKKSENNGSSEQSMDLSEIGESLPM